MIFLSYGVGDGGGFRDLLLDHSGIFFSIGPHANLQLQQILLKSGRNMPKLDHRKKSQGSGLHLRTVSRCRMEADTEEFLFLIQLKGKMFHFLSRFAGKQRIVWGPEKKKEL